VYQLYFYVPESHLEAVKNAIFKAGAGQIGNYSHCAWQARGEGQFLPLPGSNPHLGTALELTKVVEYKVETACDEACLSTVIAALKAAHPYETPAFGVTKVGT
jgi:structural toxin protein (hemagglutinin/hemolysin) RtxA